MDATDAQARLERMVAYDSPPALTSSEVAQLLGFAKRPDRYHRLPSDASWSPTWDLNAAAAEGWRWKAGKVAGGYDFQTDNQQFSRSQIQQQCLAMAKLYGGSVQSVRMHREWEWLYPYGFLPFGVIGNEDGALL